MRSRDISEKQWGSEICNNLLWQIVCAKHSPPNKVISIDLKDFCDLDQLTPPLEFDLDQSCVNAKPGSVRVSDGGWRIRARAWQVSLRFFGHFLGSLNKFTESLFPVHRTPPPFPHSYKKGRPWLKSNSTPKSFIDVQRDFSPSGRYLLPAMTQRSGGRTNQETFSILLLELFDWIVLTWQFRRIRMTRRFSLEWIRFLSWWVNLMKIIHTKSPRPYMYLHFYFEFVSWCCSHGCLVMNFLGWRCSWRKRNFTLRPVWQKVRDIG